ncbi:MAG: RNA-binding protein [Pseudomonadota bacterium]
MSFPSFANVVKSIVVAILLAVIGYFLFPTLGLDETATNTLFTLTLAAGALLGGIFSAIQFGGGSAAADSGEKKTIFVGNLAFKASPDDLSALFSKYGTVHSVRIMKDRATRRPRGFAFVEMEGRASVKAIKGLDGKEFMGRNLRVNEGAERKERNN